jgi:hypothetical protein
VSASCHGEIQIRWGGRPGGYFLRFCIRTALTGDQINFQNAPIAFQPLLRKTTNKRMTFWPAPGSEDTELGVSMEPEADHGEAEIHTHPSGLRSRTDTLGTAVLPCRAKYLPALVGLPQWLERWLPKPLTRVRIPFTRSANGLAIDAELPGNGRHRQALPM